MKANSGNFCFGFSEIRVLLPAKSASVIFIMSYNAQTGAKILNLFYFYRNSGATDGKFAKFVTMN
jgi:hypothetical protein